MVPLQQIPCLRPGAWPHVLVVRTLAAYLLYMCLFFYVSADFLSMLVGLLFGVCGPLFGPSNLVGEKRVIH